MIFVLIICLFAAACESIPVPLDEGAIIAGLPEEAVKLEIGNPFYKSVEQFDVLSLTVESRRTDERQDSVNCIVEMSNAFYQCTRYITCEYCYSNREGWQLKNWAEYREKDFRVLAFPFQETDILYAVMKKYGCFRGEVNGSVVTDAENTVFAFSAERRKPYGIVAVTGTYALTFDGDCWQEKVALDTARIWRIRP